MGISSGQLCTMISLAILSGAASVAYDQPTRLLTPPANFERVEQATSYDWCACGVQSLKVNGLDITSNNATFLLFDSPITKISWVCGNESTEHHKSLLSPSVLVSIKFTLEKKSWPCSKMSARLRWNTWRSSNKTVYKTTSTPFSSMQSGYACVKIPVLLRTKNGTLLVFAEARKDNWCVIMRYKSCNSTCDPQFDPVQISVQTCMHHTNWNISNLDCTVLISRGLIYWCADQRMKAKRFLRSSF